jgi:hypothetical protein
VANITSAFLGLVLPSQGWRCAEPSREGQHFRPSLFGTTEELADALLRDDAAGLDAYFCTATLRDPLFRVQRGNKMRGPRVGENACFRRTVVADVDLFRKKGQERIQVYGSHHDIVTTIFRFAEQSRLPLPLVVVSGGGCHFHWPFTRDLTIEEWRPLALSLHQALQRASITFDPGCTVDAIRVLRPPGTRNNKYQPPLQVVCHSLEVAPIAPEAWPLPKPVLEAREQHLTIPGIPPAALAGYSVSHARFHANTLPKSDGELVAQRCQQMRRFRDTRTGLGNNLWHSLVRVLVRCENGDALVHEWSKGDPNYSFDGAQDSIERTKADHGPTTCQYIMAIDEKGCAGCPYFGKIKSPIQLGVKILDLETAETRETTSQGDINGIPVAIPGTTDAAAAAIALPDGYLWGPGFALCERGQTIWEPDPTKPARYAPAIVIAQHPFAFTAIYRDTRGETWCQLIARTPTDEGNRYEILPAKELKGMQAISLLASKNIHIKDGKAFQRFYTASADALNATRKVKQMIDHYGWVDGRPGAFAIGDCLIEDGEQKGLTEITPLLRERAKRLDPQGTLEAWVKAFNLMLAKATNRDQSFFLVACSFGAPLMRYEVKSEGGAIVLAVNKDTSSGKTTAAQCGAAVWAPWHAINVTKDNTYNSKIAALAMFHHLPVIMDELAFETPEQAVSFVSMYSEGQERDRLRTDGSFAKALPLDFCNIIIATSNNSLQEYMTKGVPQHAMAYRVLEVLFPEPVERLAEGMDYLKHQFEDNFGHAGHAFVRYITHPQIRQQLPQWLELEHHDLEERLARLGARGNEGRFYVRTLACARLAARIMAVHRFITLPDFDPIQAIDRVADEQFLRLWGLVTEAAGMTDALLSVYLGSHLSKIIMVGEGIDLAHQANVTPIIGRCEGGMLWLAEPHLKDFLGEKHASMREFCRDLRERGLLMGRARKNLTEGVPRRVPVHHRCLVINARLLGLGPRQDAPAQSAASPPR